MRAEMVWYTETNSSRLSVLKLLYTYVKLFFKVLCKLWNFACWQTYDLCAGSRYRANCLPSDLIYKVRKVTACSPRVLGGCPQQWRGEQPNVKEIWIRLPWKNRLSLRTVFCFCFLVNWVPEGSSSVFLPTSSLAFCSWGKTLPEISFQVLHIHRRMSQYRKYKLKLKPSWVSLSSRHHYIFF